MDYVVVCFLVHFRAKNEDEQIFVVGSDACLGSWTVPDGLRLENVPRGSPQWVGVTRLPKEKTEFKVVAVTSDGSVRWEDAVANREIVFSAETREMIVSLSFDDPQYSVDVTQEPTFTSRYCGADGVAVHMPYWRHNTKETFYFVQRQGEQTERHECAYDQEDGTVTAILHPPKDKTLTGYFEVQQTCGTVRKSDFRCLTLPSNTCEVVWPFSNLQGHIITELDCPENEPCGLDGSDILSREVAPPVENTVSPMGHPGKKQLKSKKKGFRRMIKRIRRLFTSKKKVVMEDQPM